MVIPPSSLPSLRNSSIPALLPSLSLPCIVVVVKHISSSSGRQLRVCSGARLVLLQGFFLLRATGSLSSSSTQVRSKSSSAAILRVRFFDIVSRGSSEIAGDSVYCEDFRVEGRWFEKTFMMYTMRGRRVGRQPDIIPIEGSTEDQMKTSLLAQLMSWVLTRRVMVMMR